MKYELVVFDWDGTLLDSAGAIVQAIQAACRDLGHEPPSDARPGM
jgi:phosphoglycolate phosphatase